LTGPPVRGPGLTPDARKLLNGLLSWCRQNHVRVAYALPWGFTPADQAARFRRDNLEFILQVVDCLPVLRDPTLGARTEPHLFADTNLHLTPEGARLRSDELAREVANWDLWPPDELRRLARESP
jgi:hypothetical protein